MSKREINNAFAEWLRMQMHARGYLTVGSRAGGQARLADDSGVSVSVISRTLNEGRTPDIDSLRLLGRVLGYSLGEMLVRAGKAQPGELPVRERTATPEGAGVPVAGGVDPDLIAELAIADPAAIEAVRAVLRATKRDD